MAMMDKMYRPERNGLKQPIGQDVAASNNFISGNTARPGRPDDEANKNLDEAALLDMEREQQRKNLMASMIGDASANLGRGNARPSGMAQMSPEERFNASLQQERNFSTQRNAEQEREELFRRMRLQSMMGRMQG
jgi:hypothetical protein